MLSFTVSALWNICCVYVVYVYPMFGVFILLCPFVYHAIRSVGLSKINERNYETHVPFNGKLNIVVFGKRKREILCSIANQTPSGDVKVCVFINGDEIPETIIDNPVTTTPGVTYGSLGCLNAIKVTTRRILPEFDQDTKTLYVNNPISRYAIANMAAYLDRNEDCDLVMTSKAVGPLINNEPLCSIIMDTGLSYNSRLHMDTRGVTSWDGKVAVMSRTPILNTNPDNLVKQGLVVLRDPYSYVYTYISPTEECPRVAPLWKILFSNNVHVITWLDAFFAIWEFHTIPLIYVMPFMLQYGATIALFVLWSVPHAIYLVDNQHMIYGFLLYILLPFRLATWFRLNEPTIDWTTQVSYINTPEDDTDIV